MLGGKIDFCARPWPADPDLDGAARGDRAAPVPLRGEGADPAEGARLRPRPGAARRRRRLLPGGAEVGATCSAISARASFRRPQALQGPSGLRPAGTADDLFYHKDQTVRQSDRPVARKADPRPGRLEDRGRSSGRGKVFVDWSQNHRSKTTIAVYSLRARERPTASTPVTWKEVERAPIGGRPPRWAPRRAPS